MDRQTFAILCHLLRTIVGLSSTDIVDVEEMVVMFLHVLAHDVKNQVIIYNSLFKYVELSWGIGHDIYKGERAAN